MANYPDLNRKRLKGASDNVYLIVDGTRQWIPDADTFNNLFRDWGGIIYYPGIDGIDEGPALATGAVLAKSSQSDPVYLVSNNQKRFIVNSDVFNDYNFAWGNIVVLPPVIMDSIPTGAPLP